MQIPLRSIMGGLIAITLIGVLIHTAMNEQGRLDRRQEMLRAQAIEVGADLFELHCRACHGAKGEGVGQLGPPLSDKKFFTSRLLEVGWPDTLESYIIATTAQGRLMATRPMYAGDGKTAVMAPWLDKYGGPCRNDQIQDLAEFIMNWKPTAMGNVVLAELVVPKTNLSNHRTVSRGREVFMEHCGTCHSIRGIQKADKKGPNLTGIAQTAIKRKRGLSAEEYIRESFLLPDAFIVEGFEPKELGYRCGGLLSVSQLDEVTAFLLNQDEQ
jgi:mono/diheme cytochrome c family protein